MKILRFLRKNEFVKTKELATECFGNTDDLEEYYSKDVFDNRIAVIEENGKIISMVHLKRMIADFKDVSVSLWYILYVATKKQYQKKGYMKKTLGFVLDTLKKEGESFTFLVPVNEDVYKNSGFTFKWRFNNDEADLLYADDGLEYAFGCSLNEEFKEPPLKIKKASSLRDLKYQDFDDLSCVENFEYFYIRHNKSYDSLPLDFYIWNKTIETKYSIVDNRCLMMRDKSGKTISGCIPFCKEEELVYYFKLQERYFNDVLQVPFSAYLADREGVEFLKKHGALDNYVIKEDEEIFDYIYSGEDLRTLKGKKFSDKRNRINKFLRDYNGRWSYSSLNSENSEEILSFLEKWYSEKKIVGKGVNLGETYDAAKTLKIEQDGLKRILKNKKLLSKVKLGGIYVDGVLSAFSLGGYNPKEKMAVIEIEKAFSKMEGLYQLINREFLIHEFNDAQIVNREDDDGLPGLRKSKMSYNPIEFEKRFTLIQKDYNEENVN